MVLVVVALLVSCGGGAPDGRENAGGTGGDAMTDGGSGGHAMGGGAPDGGTTQVGDGGILPPAPSDLCMGLVQDKQARPMTPLAKPALGQTVIDAEFGTRIRRISDWMNGPTVDTYVVELPSYAP